MSDMEKPWNEPLPESELEHFKDLEDIQVVFDVGARTSLDYLQVKPDIELHLFEPWPPFYEWLKEATKDNPKVHVNGYGLDKERGSGIYNISLQAFEGGEMGKLSGEPLPLETLDGYIEENSIKRLDFLKIDTEAHDFNVLLGGKRAIEMARYIQYEHWNDTQQFHELLAKDFDMDYIGYRNVLCKRKV